MPCWEKFEAQEQGYRDGVIGTAPRIAIEAGVGFGWEKWLGGRGQFIGMKGFGASAPADKLYEHFGITAQAVVEAARTMLGRG